MNITGLSTNASPLTLLGGAEVDLFLIGTNTLTGGAGAPGVQVTAGRKLRINGTGGLTATCGTDSAGIGGSAGGSANSQAGGDITINGGFVNAAGNGRKRIAPAVIVCHAVILIFDFLAHPIRRRARTHFMPLKSLPIGALFGDDDSELTFRFCVLRLALSSLVFLLAVASSFIVSCCSMMS